jgi:AraC-like DNA-binding protein
MMSPTYVSEFFKKQVHLPLREYVLKAKIKLVILIIRTEIADELGFTDVSPLKTYIW